MPTLLFHNDATIIGANVLQQHDVIFDLDHDRIGFAEQDNCAPGLTLVPPSSAETRGRNIDVGNPTNATTTTNSTNVRPHHACALTR